MDAAATAEAFVCPNCGHQAQGVYCGHCGQRRPEEREYSLPRACREFLHELLDVDGRIFSSIKLLFLKPGQLTLDHFEGRRASHVSPLRLFLIFSALYFLVDASPAQIMYSRFHGTMEKALLAKAAATGVSHDLLLQDVKSRLVVALKVVTISTVLTSGLCLWLFFRGQRRYLVQHMITALHVSCVWMTIMALLGRLGAWLDHESIVSGITAVAQISYANLALKTAYPGGFLPRHVGAVLAMYFSGLLLKFAVMIPALFISIR
jgi:hypothetical protein